MGSPLWCSVLAISTSQWGMQIQSRTCWSGGWKWRIQVPEQGGCEYPSPSQSHHSYFPTSPLGQVHIYFPIGYLDVVFPKLTSPPYRMKMDVRQYGHKSLSNPPNLAQTGNHHTLLPPARMPDTPVCNEIYAAGLMNPQSADRLWYTNRCSIKLAVTMFKAAELECCLQSLSSHRIVVLEPAPASAPANGHGYNSGAAKQQKGRRQLYPGNGKCTADRWALLYKDRSC